MRHPTRKLHCACHIVHIRKTFANSVLERKDYRKSSLLGTVDTSIVYIHLRSSDVGPTMMTVTQQSTGLDYLLLRAIVYLYYTLTLPFVASLTTSSHNPGTTK